MQSYFNLSRNLSTKKATLPALVCLTLGTLLAGSVQAAGTDVSTPVQNSVTLSYQVNNVNQTASTSVTFNVDRKLVLDVTTTDTDWVPVVPSQDVTTAGAALPALNFTVTNSSNDATNIVLGLIDQDGNAVTGFSVAGSAFANTPGAVVVAIDDGGTPATPTSDGVYTQGVDTVLTADANGVYSLGNLPIDGTANVLVAISVDGAEANNVYRSYTLVAGVADAGGAPFTPSSLDDSGNIAPGSGATPTEVANGLTTVETVWADAGAPVANADDEQFDFFTGNGTNAIDGVADGQSSDASGFTTRVALSLAKNAVVLYDPITGNRFSDRDTEDAEPKAIPGAVIMYVIGVANESATLAANAVTLNDTLPTEVTAGDQANPATAIVIPNAASFAVGGLTPNFDLSSVTDLDVVSHLACSTPASAPAYTGAAPITGVGGDVGNCAAGATAYIVYFVTLD